MYKHLLRLAFRYQQHANKTDLRFVSFGPQVVYMFILGIQFVAVQCCRNFQKARFIRLSFTLPATSQYLRVAGDNNKTSCHSDDVIIFTHSLQEFKNLLSDYLFITSIM